MLQSSQLEDGIEVVGGDVGEGLLEGEAAHHLQLQEGGSSPGNYRPAVSSALELSHFFRSEAKSLECGLDRCGLPPGSRYSRSGDDSWFNGFGETCPSWQVLHQKEKNLTGGKGSKEMKEKKRGERGERGERTIGSSEVGDGDGNLRASGDGGGNVESESVSNDIEEGSGNGTVGSSAIESSERGSG